MTVLMDTYADRQANIDLLDRLTVWLDEDIGSKPDNIFDHDVSVRTPGGEANGFDNAVAQARRTHSETEINQHLTTNPIIRITGGAATVRTNFIVAFGPVDMDGPARSMGGLYLLETVRVETGWRIRRLEVKPLWRAGEWQEHQQ